MDLREALLAEHSKAQTNRIVRWIGDDQRRFDELFSLFFNDNGLIAQRAAWSLSYAVDAHPQFIAKHLRKLLLKLKQKGNHDAIKRNGIRLLQGLNIPVKFQGEVMNLCFDYITDPKEKPAVKAFSLTVLQHLSRQYPEISNELKVVIESQWENESAAFKSRARRIIGNKQS